MSLLTAAVTGRSTWLSPRNDYSRAVWYCSSLIETRCVWYENEIHVVSFICISRPSWFHVICLLGWTSSNRLHLNIVRSTEAGFYAQAVCYTCTFGYPHMDQAGRKSYLLDVVSPVEGRGWLPVEPQQAQTRHVGGFENDIEVTVSFTLLLWVLHWFHYSKTTSHQYDKKR